MTLPHTYQHMKSANSWPNASLFRSHACMLLCDYKKVKRKLSVRVPHEIRKPCLNVTVDPCFGTEQQQNTSTLLSQTTTLSFVPWQERYQLWGPGLFDQLKKPTFRERAEIALLISKQCLTTYLLVNRERETYLTRISVL